MFPADDNEAIPSPRQVEYASMDRWTCGRQTATRESPTTAESETNLVGVVGAELRVSACIARMPLSGCCADAADPQKMAPATATHRSAREGLDWEFIARSINASARLFNR
jgi:hypothetical protein